MRIATFAVLTTAGLLLADVSMAGDRTSIYPEGSIFLAPPAAKPMSLAQAPQPATLSPLNPLSQPTSGNVWKPSNRDAGNLAAQRWQDYADMRAQALDVEK
jgi:hypothetical protein